MVPYHNTIIPTNIVPTYYHSTNQFQVLRVGKQSLAIPPHPPLLGARSAPPFLPQKDFAVIIPARTRRPLAMHIPPSEPTVAAAAAVVVIATGLHHPPPDQGVA